jgi:hypothetical protein
MTHQHDTGPGEGIRRVPTISRVEGDTLIELVYDPARQQTGLAVSRFGGLFNIEQEVRVGNEVLVPYSANNNLIARGSVLFASRPEHHGDKAELLEEIGAFLRRYVDLSPMFEQIAAHYVLLSWVHDAFNELPYLRFQGDYGTGKTRGLLAVGQLCYKPFFASGASTVSPIFHILDTFGGTLLLDEADFRFSDATAELVKILNNGTMRGLPVLRTMQTKDGELNPRSFRVFGPKLVSMRGSYEDDALESRFLSENMNLRTMREDIPINLPSEMREEALALRNKLLHFRFCTLLETRLNTDRVKRNLEPRLNQIALPLLSLVDEESLVGSIRQHVVEQRAAGAPMRNRRVLIEVVRAIQQAFADEAMLSVTVREIADRVRTILGSESPKTSKQFGVLIRKQLGIGIYKSNGVHAIARTEMATVTAAATRLGMERDSTETS